MVTSTCPQADDLRSFHLGMLDERRELEVLDHLNACPACEDTVANLEGTADSLVAAVRHSAESESSESDDRPALQQALAEIEGLIDSPPTAASAHETAPPVSERIRDYELLGTLGEGGMGTVYRARHTRLDRQVALKLLPARRLRDDAAVARFEREMKAIGRLDHPAIVRATDAGDVDGTHFLAMDYVEGIDLSKLVRLVGPLDVASACEIVRQAAIGLDYAHQQELIHRDVKPSNLMLTLRGDVKVLDLGLALFGAASEALDELTTVGQLMGTLDYMAPEQGDDSHDVDARADVYSLGATLFKLLTATAPYDSPGTRTPLAKMKALATIDAPSVAERREELPTELVTIVDRALLRNVNDRFASANELADSLLPFCEGHVLSDLAECGRDLALREDEKIPQPPTLPPFVQKSEIPASPANVTRAESLGNRPPGIGRRIATWMLIPLVLLAGIVIWIQTDNGTLVVESPSGDIPIEIRTGGKFHSNATLSVGKNELTIRSGTYEIVLPKEYDSLKVENNVFTLERGGEWIARVTSSQKESPVASEPDETGLSVTEEKQGSTPQPRSQPLYYAIMLGQDDRATRHLQSGDLIDVYLEQISPTETQPAVIKELVAERLPIIAITQGANYKTVVVQVTEDQEDCLHLAGKVKAVSEVFSAVQCPPGSKTPKEPSIRRFDPNEAERQIEARAGLVASATADQSPSHSTSATNATRRPSNAIGGPKSTSSGLLSETPQSTLVFSGKTFEEWQRAVLTERNPLELEKAVQALCILGRNNRDAEAAATVLQVVDAYPGDMREGSGEAALVASSIKSLRTLDATNIVSEIAKATRNGRHNTRALVLGSLSGGTGYTATAQPLVRELNKSEEFHQALLDIFTELEPDNRQFAFRVLYNALNSQPPDPRLIPFLKTCMQKSEPDSVTVSAAGRLAELRPTPELADVFLNHLEGTQATLKKLRAAEQMAKWGGPPVGLWKQDWWDLEASAWMGLAALGKHAAGSVDRIVQLVEVAPGELGEPKHLYLREAPSFQVKAQYEIHRQLLAIEILALIGPEANVAVPMLNKVLEDLTGHVPTADGDYGFDGFLEELILERAIGHSLQAKKQGMGFKVPEGTREVPDRAQRLNSALQAIQRITGEFPRFDVDRIDANGPSGQTGAMGGGYRGGGSAEMMAGYGEGYDGEGEYGDSMQNEWLPRLVTYKGKSFAEWTDPRSDPRNVAKSAMSLGELRDVFMGASLLAKTPQERTTASETAIFAYEYAIRQPWKLTPELRKFLVDTVEASHSLNPDALMTPIEDTLAQVTPARQTFMLTELLVPVEESDFGFRLHERPFSREVVANPQFPNAYNDLVENWDKHPSVLQEAILQVEAHLPALGRKSSVRLLTRLLKESLDTIGDGAIPVALPTDLHMKAAFILAATSPKDPTIQGQLEKLLAGILARPHVLRRRVDNETGKAPQLEERVKAPTMRDLDADRLHAAVALKLACGGALSETTARQFARLIIQDTERHEVGTFRIVSPPNGSDIRGISSGFGQPDKYGEDQASGYAGGSGYPGMGGGLPGVSRGYPVAAEPGGGEHRPEAIVNFQGTAFSSDHGEFSRRVLMAHLLLTVPPDDLAVKHEIGELFANWLMENYPGTVLPSPGTEMTDPQTMSGNVSLYSLIETEFRSGVRYRKRPSNKEKSKETTLETLRFIDAVSRIVPNYISEGLLRHIQQKHLAARAATESGRPFSANTAEITFDGRPFEEWRSVVATERSPERLVEAVQALTILGKHGRDAEAARAILSCLAPFKFNSVNKDDPTVALTVAVRQGLFKLDQKALMPAVAETILHGNSNQRRFFFKFNSTRLRAWLEPDGPLMKPQSVSVFLAATHDDEGDIRQLATTFLAPLLLAEGVPLDASEQGKVRDRLIELLADEAVRVPAGVCLSKLAPLTKGLPEILVNELSRLGSQKLPEMTYRLCDVHWALRTLMKNPKLQNELNGQLVKLLDNLDQNRNQWLYHEVQQNLYFTPASLLIETLLEYQQNSGTKSQAFPKLLRKLAGPMDANADIDDFSPVEASPTNAIGKSYSPILNDDYRYPLPISSYSHLGQTTVALDVNAAAAKWALQQLAKSSLPEKHDE